jgi:hypothetical protein
MDTVQSAALDTPVNRRSRKPEGTELSTSNNPVLSCREVGDSPVIA